jgi:glycosyltransferase involved in cell wall biosynthesis
LSQILEAASALSQVSDLQFVLLGDGPEKQALVDQTKREGLENIRFLQSRPSSELPPLVAAADIILVTLKIYIPGAVPSKIYEAMSSGRPIVLVAEGEAADIIREHRAGIVVKPGDIPGLTEAIRTLHSQPSLRQNLGENGRRAAEQFFDRAKIAMRFIEYLEAGIS